MNGKVLVVDRLPQFAVLKQPAGIEGAPVMAGMGGVENDIVGVELRILGTTGGVTKLSDQEIAGMGKPISVGMTTMPKPSARMGFDQG